MITRTIAAYIAAPVLAVTGFRFGKQYRWGVSAFHRVMFALVDTVQANLLANVMAPVAELQVAE